MQLEVSVFILAASVMWIVIYFMLNLDALILWKRMPKVPRTFRAPLGPVLPVAGIVGEVIMIYGIDSDWSVKLWVYAICILLFGVLSVYAIIWVKRHMRKQLFETVPVREVMAMENEQYHLYHKQKSKIEEMQKKIAAPSIHN